MPRYYFDIRDADGVVHDEEGSEFADLRAVQGEAVTSLADISKDLLVTAGSHRLSIEVRDEHKRQVLVAVLTLEANLAQ